MAAVWPLLNGQRTTVSVLRENDAVSATQRTASKVLKVGRYCSVQTDEFEQIAHMTTKVTSMASTGKLSLLVLLGWCLPLPVVGQTDAPRVKKELGPKTGSTITEFSLRDQSGNRQETKKLLAKGPLAIVFYRSADW